MAHIISKTRQHEIEEEEENLNDFLEAIRGGTNDEDPINPTLESIERAQHNPMFNRLFDEILRNNANAHFLRLAQEGAKLPSDFDTAQILQTLEKHSHNDGGRGSDYFRYDLNQGNPPPPPPTKIDMLRQQVENLAQELNSGVKTTWFSLNDICPYPFDRNMHIPPFLQGFETPKFEKYRGKGDPRDHV